MTNAVEIRRVKRNGGTWTGRPDNREWRLWREKIEKIEKKLEQHDARFNALEVKIEAIRGNIQETRVDLARWNHGAVVGMISLFGVGLFGLLFIIWNASKMPPPMVARALATPAAQAPIVIQIPSNWRLDNAQDTGVKP